MHPSWVTVYHTWGERRARPKRTTGASAIPSSDTESVARQIQLANQIAAAIARLLAPYMTDDGESVEQSKDLLDAIVERPPG